MIRSAPAIPEGQSKDFRHQNGSLHIPSKKMLHDLQIIKWEEWTVIAC